MYREMRPCFFCMSQPSETLDIQEYPTHAPLKMTGCSGIGSFNFYIIIIYFFYPPAAPEPGHEEIHYLAPDIQAQSGAGQTRGCSGSVELSWVSIMVSFGYGLGYGLRKGLVRLVMGTRVGVADLAASGLEAAASVVDVESPPAPFKWPGSRPAGWTCGSGSCSC